MPQYFDPTRRAAVLPPPPVAVKARPVSTPGAYFDPHKTRRSRSPYPTAEEIAALVASFDTVILRSAEEIKTFGETVERWVERRIGWRRPCACGALGEGEFGHRPLCQQFREWRFRFDNWWWGRRRAADGLEDGEPETYDGSDLPF